MKPESLASHGDFRGMLSALASLCRWGFHHPVVVLAVVAVWAICIVWAFRWSKRQAREPLAEKATVNGTARVLSIKQVRSMTRQEAIQTELTGYYYGPRKTSPWWCRIRLEVHIPGREPYVTVMRMLLTPQRRAAVQQGATIRVRIDPNDDPKNVYMDC